MPLQPPTRSRHRSRVPAPSAGAASLQAPARRATAPGAQQPSQLHASLPAVPSTLLIPLAARARGDRYFPWLACGDAVAAGLLERLGADVEGYLDDLPTVLNVLWRTRFIRDTAQGFFLLHPEARGVNLGCGLSHHFQWLDTGANHWLDADLPEVIALRRQLLPPGCPRTRLAEVDITRPGWWQRLGQPPRGPGTRGAPQQPVLVLCEGVLMYLEPAQVQAFLAEFAECAPAGSRLVLDVLTHRAVGTAHRHASVGPTGAEFRWGVARLSDLPSAHPRLALLHEHSVAECYGWAGLALETLWWPWLGAPLYGMVTLGVGD
ncbi:class I SAM-dependent methyltransferase [Acidovorax sp. sic0104]|uniref:class I SAM-dependent methyltransferase n=1 Tax=Acidovorax sp. sic0104 TaxID=2854784 RepID=UPI0021040DD9|nr:class I SAM-dependent methyltransferase [Acidovorax sp. sic0104]